MGAASATAGGAGEVGGCQRAGRGRGCEGGSGSRGGGSESHE